MKQTKKSTWYYIGLWCIACLVAPAVAYRGYYGYGYRPYWGGWGYYGPYWSAPYPYYYDPVASAFVTSAAIASMTSDKDRPAAPQSGVYTLTNNTRVPVTVTTDGGQVQIAPSSTMDVPYKNRKTRISIRNPQGGGAGLKPSSQRLIIEESHDGRTLVHSL